MAENAASVRPSAERPGHGSLGPRLGSALVMIPLALFAAWQGGLWIGSLVAVAAGLMGWEWGALVGRVRTIGDKLMFCAIGPVAILASALASAPVGLLLGAAGILAQWALGRGRDATPLWTAAGLAWIIAPLVGLIWLRADPGAGLAVTFWLLAVVWTTDTAAYAAGRSLGGPRLAPRISPNKTWSGLIGGILGAGIVGLVTDLVLPDAGGWGFVALSAGLAIVDQIGDIAESFAKRRFGAKDSGRLIPGHGGLLDRLDGMLAVVAVIVILQVATGGNILRWHQA
jgi:phosphatidate cytidylyltransferase